MKNTPVTEADDTFFFPFPSNFYVILTLTSCAWLKLCQHKEHDNVEQFYYCVSSALFYLCMSRMIKAPPDVRLPESVAPRMRSESGVRRLAARAWEINKWPLGSQMADQLYHRTKDLHRGTCRVAACVPRTPRRVRGDARHAACRQTFCLDGTGWLPSSSTIHERLTISEHQNMQQIVVATVRTLNKVS